MDPLNPPLVIENLHKYNFLMYGTQKVAIASNAVVMNISRNFDIRIVLSFIMLEVKSRNIVVKRQLRTTYIGVAYLVTANGQPRPSWSQILNFYGISLGLAMAGHAELTANRRDRYILPPAIEMPHKKPPKHKTERSCSSE